ncbi:MAG: immune inhibitor A [Actinomycetota bacterium]|nr:immune inhibitor A [Actinomycetota bacterium]
MSLSVRGIARQYRNVTGGFWVRQGIFGGSVPSPGSLRTRLVSLARREFSFSVSECIYGWTAAFEQTWSLVRVRIRLNPDAGITEETMNTLRTRWRQGIQDTWSNRWAVGRAGEIACPLQIQVLWVTTNQHHAVRVRAEAGRSNMTLWDTQDTAGVAAHEFGHMLGHPDEYTDGNCPNRSPVSTGTVMDNNSTTVPARLMTRFANNIGSNVVAL